MKKELQEYCDNLDYMYILEEVDSYINFKQLSVED